VISPTSSILLILAAAAGGTLFHVSFEVSELDDRLGKLNRDIRTDREAIHVLRAEWSFLNQPNRLEELARRHLNLQPVSGSQLIDAGALPMRSKPALRVMKSHDSPNNPGTAIRLQAVAPKLKPAAPILSLAIPVASTSIKRANDSRSLDDVLREVVKSGQSPAKAGVQ
jgi:hypothetical protein